MDRAITFARSSAWCVLGIIVALVAVAAFLRDLFPHDLRAWTVAGLVVAGAAATIAAFKRESLGRSLMWLASLAVVTLLIIYDLLDAMLDPFLEADWLIAVVAGLLVIGLGSLLGVLISEED